MYAIVRVLECQWSVVLALATYSYLQDPPRKLLMFLCNICGRALYDSKNTPNSCHELNNTAVFLLLCSDCYKTHLTRRSLSALDPPTARGGGGTRRLLSPVTMWDSCRSCALPRPVCAPPFPGEDAGAGSGSELGLGERYELGLDPLARNPLAPPGASPARWRRPNANLLPVPDFPPPAATVWREERAGTLVATEGGATGGGAAV
jgi:hypothetical protein